MRRAIRILAWVIGLVIAIPVGLVLAVLVLANIAPGQRLLANLVTQASGGMVQMSGLSGRFPDRLRVAHLAVRDIKGDWITIDNAALDWSPFALLRRNVSVADLSATQVHVLRLPQSAPATKPATPAPPSTNLLPVQVSLSRLHIDHLVLDQPVAGVAATVSADGAAYIQRLDLAGLPNQSQATLHLDLERQDSPGSYKLDANVSPSHLTANLTANEPAGGLISQAAKLPDLGAIATTLKLDGPQSAAVLDLALSAGQLRATAQGPLDLVHQAAQLQVHANAPAMSPRPDIAWQSVAVDAQVHGPFTAPDAQATIRIAGVSAAGATLGLAALDVAGNQGAVNLTGSLQNLRIPGPQPDLLAAAPVQIAATAQLSAPGRPVTFRITHPLLEADADAKLEPELQATLHATLPNLAPFGALGGIALAGRTTVTATAAQHNDATQVTAQGNVAITGGMAPLPGLIGDSATISAAATLQGQDFLLDHVTVNGRTLTAQASGSDRGGTLALDFRAALSDLAVVQPSLAGNIAAQGHIEGPQNALAATADITGQVAAHGYSSGPLQAHLAALNLPGAPQVTFTAGGELAGAPLAIDASVSRGTDGALAARIDRLDWQSAHAQGAVNLPAGATLPIGKLDLRMTQLDQLRPFIGLPITGSLQASLDRPQENAPAKLAAQARNAGIPGNSVRTLDLQATLADPEGARIADVTLKADGIAAAGASGRVALTAKGPQTAVAIKLDADLRDPSGTPARIAAAANVDAVARHILLSTLTADWHGLAARLLGPARVDLAQGVAVDRLRLGVGDATLDLAGRLSPRLDATLAIRNVTPALAKPFDPSLSAEGIIQADAKLTGDPTAPQGQIRLTADRLRILKGPGSALPPANLQATANLAGGNAKLDARATAGTTTLTVTGTAPLQPTRPVSLQAGGTIDLSLLDPILLAEGRRVRGTITLDATVTGTAQAPVLGGTIRLAKGDVQDFTQGVHITDMAALIQLERDTIRIASFTGHAGPGTIGATGTVGVLAPGLPLDLTITANNARLLASDRITAQLDANLTINGQAATDMAVAGTVHIDQAEIRVPERLPVSVVSLDVRRPGEAPPPPSAPGPNITLNVAIQAPNPIFVRGRGLFAVLEGNMRVTGTAAKPVPQGQLTMQRGTISVVGTTLTFSRGNVQFAGSITDPLIDFVAQSSTATVVATLEVTGSASNPQIKLSSVPSLPQDEVLSQLLFGQSTSQLSPFQLAEIAQALAQFGGVDIGINNPLDRLRRGLGLDRLSVGGGGATGSTPTLEAGTYVANGVYLGAKQGLGGGSSTNAAGQTTSGTETQATVQIDLTRRLKIEADVGAGAGGDAAGLTYQFEY